MDECTTLVVGNCFSLQKEHETALRYFQRALQLDPRCTYAHTLCGRGLHSSTFRLNLSALYEIGDARRGCVARVKGVTGGVGGCLGCVG